MKYGAMNFPVNPLLDELEKISDLGFDYLELTMDPPCAHFTNVLGLESELVKALEHSSMDLVCHLPTFVYTADLAPGIRKASLNEMIQSLKTAARIGTKKSVLHPSVISGLGPFVMDTAARYAHDSLCTIIDMANHLKIDLCFENMFPKYNSFFDTSHFKTIFKKFPGLKMTLDTGHANIDDPSQKKLYEFIQIFPDKIGHIHISDNLGKKDDHFKVGQGNINFKKFIKQIKQSGYNDTITFEIFSQNSEDLLESRNIIKKMLEKIE